MKTNPLTALVTGVTGRQGGAVARALMQKGHSVKAMTRHPDSAAARELKKLGADIVTGDLADRPSVERACQGITSMFVVTTPFEQGLSHEIQQGKNAADAAKATGVRHLLYTSAASANQQTGVGHLDSKYEVEKYIASLNIPHTIIAPTFFLQNLSDERMFLPALRQGKLSIALPATRTLQCIDVTDIGNFATMVFERRDEFLGKRIDIASDELTPSQMAQRLSRVCGRQIEFSQLPIEKVRAMNADLATMFEWFDRVGMNANINDLRGSYPEAHWHTFEQWAKAQNWSALLGVAETVGAAGKH